MRVPSDCENDECTYLTKWRNESDKIEFIVSTKQDLTISEYWLGIAFSTDRKMGDDSVVICKFRQKSEASSIESYYNEEKEEPIYVDQKQKTYGLSDALVSIDQVFLTCGFKRLKTGNFPDRFFDLNNDYYLFMAKGRIKNDDGLGFHHKERTISKSKLDFNFVQEVNFTSYKLLVKYHGILMIFSWVFLASTSLLIASMTF